MERHLGKDKTAVFAVNFEEAPEVLAILKKDARKDQWYINLLRDPDGRISRLYEVHAIPRMYLIGTDGKIRATHEGFGDGSLEEMIEELNEVLRKTPTDASAALGS